MWTLRLLRRSAAPMIGSDDATFATAPPAYRSPIIRRRRTLWLVIAATIAAATAGWVANAATSSPAELAAEAGAQPPSLVTAPVELRVLATTIVTRGDVRFAATTELTVDGDVGAPGAEAGRLVITGQLPEVGRELGEGAVAVEVSGRPVFVLDGALPMYRELAVGATGADVRQLEEALARLGYAPGVVDERFDRRTGDAIEAWYEAAGYQPVGPTEADLDRLTAAEAAVRAAEDTLADAEAALAAAEHGPSRAEVIAAEQAVDIARLELDNAIADRDDALAAAAPADRERVRREHDLLVRRAESQLTIAQAQLDALTAAPDTALERAAVDRAADAFDAARAELDDVEAAVSIRVPRGEVVFMPDLPRRVEAVQVGVGDEPAGAVLTISGSDVQVEANVPVAERQLLAEGDRVRIDEETLGIDQPGTIVGISDTPGEDGTHQVRIRPDRPDADQLAGANVRVTIPVESSDGEVLAVPAAAVWTTVEGRSWVRVLGSDGSAEDIAVQVGLAADGFLEISPVDRPLNPGDPVVLGLR